VDDAERNYFPRPPDASGQDAIHAHPPGRERSFGPLCRLVGDDDQLLKSAAHNAVQIAEALRSG
jgi:aspartate-semialdehyde dehydrogenase